MFIPKKHQGKTKQSLSNLEGKRFNAAFFFILARVVALSTIVITSSPPLSKIIRGIIASKLAKIPPTLLEKNIAKQTAK